LPTTLPTRLGDDSLTVWSYIYTDGGTSAVCERTGGINGYRFSVLEVNYSFSHVSNS